MNSSKNAFTYFPEGPNEGEETEAEKQLKFLLKKQLNTKIDIHEILQQKKEFSNVTHVELTSQTKGKVSLSELLKIENENEQKEYLQYLGLSETEINLYLEFSESGVPMKKSLIDPSIKKEQYKEIQKKIEDKLNNQKTSDTFAGAKALSRQAMEIEKSLYAGSKKELNNLKNMVTKVKSDDDVKHPDHPINNLNKILSDLLERKSAVNRDHKQVPDNNCSSYFDPAVYNAVVPIPLSEISSNRISLEEIKAMPRFKDYDPGVTSKTLFLKNLHRSVSLAELIALFNHFQCESCDDNKFIPIDYRLMSGRMKGQAFIKFPDLELAVKAYEAVNGYKLRDKPIIIMYGNK
ncbi:RNA-binding protein 41 [Nymphon striatum]|nr:RNA-binding protein 41 [Nymphon striatum]